MTLVYNMHDYTPVYYKFGTEYIFLTSDKTKDRVTRTPIKAMYNLNYGVRHLNCQNNK
jgi:hypothetical protein